MIGASIHGAAFWMARILTLAPVQKLAYDSDR